MNKTVESFRQIAPELNPHASPKLLKPEEIALKNGIKTYVFNDPMQPAFQLDIMISAGRAHASQPLVASTALKMLREGTSAHTARKLNNIIEYHGAFLNLSTTPDYSYLTLNCIDKKIPTLLPLIRNLLEKPNFPEVNFKLLNGRQKSEFRQNNLKIRQLAGQIYRANLYGEDTPYGKMVFEEDFDRLNLADLRNFHRDYIHPANAKVILSGNVNPKVLKALDDSMGSWQGQTEQSIDFVQQTQFRPQQIFKEKADALQSIIMMGRPVMARNHPDYYAFLVLNELLGGFFGSRLMSNLREDKGYTYGIYSAITPLRKATAFTIQSEVGSDVSREAVIEIRKELLKLMDETVGEAELTLVKNYLNGQYLRALDGIFNQVEKFKAAFDTGLGLDYYRRSLEAIHAVNAEQIRETAQKYLDPDLMLCLVVGKNNVF